MKINELSRLTGINPETIRSYRNKGLLHPVRMENGYYDYSAADYVSLAYIRKMRGYSFAIDEISRLYQSQSPDYLLNVYSREKEFLQSQIADLENRIRYLELEERHVRESSAINEVMILQSIDEKIDFYDLDYFLENEHATHRLGIYTMLSPTVWISPEVLNGETDDPWVQIRIGIGTYRYLFKELNTAAPETAIVIPNGISVSQMLEISDINTIERKQLEPMISYARDRGLRYVSGTTGFLMNIERRGEQLICHFRIRAIIEENTIISAG